LDFYSANSLKQNSAGRRIQTVKAWPIDPFDFKSFKQEVSEKLPQG